MADNPTPKKGMMSFKIPTVSTLHQSYMPFLKNGGLFIPTPKNYTIGADVFLVLELLKGGEKVPIAAKVAWITPTGAQGNKTAGIGVHFDEMDNGVTRGKIEKLLVGFNSKAPTHTL